jgi:hypothetical protein
MKTVAKGWWEDEVKWAEFPRYRYQGMENKELED